MMKLSGVDWIGEIPDTWIVSRVNRLFENHDFERVPVEASERTHEGDVEYPYYGANGVQDYIDGYIFDSPSVLIGEDGSVLKEDGTPYVTFADGRYWVNNHAHVLMETEGYSLRYGYYSLSAANIFGLVNGSTRAKLTQTALNHMLLPVPDYAEQIQIAECLDIEVGKLDEAASILDKQLSILERYKVSLIHEAVTKGLDNTVAMKPSDVEWIGEIPINWKITKLRAFGSCQNGISKSGEYFGSGYPFISYGNVYRDEINNEKAWGQIESNAEERQRYSVLRGDVFFTRTSETIDEVGIATASLSDIPNACFAGFLIRVRPYDKEAMLPEYARYYFHVPRASVHDMNRKKICHL